MFVLSLQSQSGIMLITCIFMINSEFGPIVIGGIGGSGTRLIAQILKELKFFIGHDLNEPLDNLSFTLLFKRPEWFYKNTDNKNDIFTGLSILEKSMLKSFPTLTTVENCFLEKATDSMFKFGHNLAGDGKGKWAIERLNRIKKGRPENEIQNTGWGWKEPNSHLLLPYLNSYFPNLRYIHTIRNGLDMAYSSNQQQLFNWGPMYGIDLPKTDIDIPEASFKYWVAANMKVIDIGEKIGSRNFYCLNFDNLICNDKKEILNLLSFIGVEAHQSIIDLIESIIKKPVTFQRFKKYNTDWFSSIYKKELNYFGFTV